MTVEAPERPVPPRAKRRMRAEELRGVKGISVPRLYTKPLRELTPETTLGFEVIDFAREELGIELYPWQQWLLKHALELLESGQYRYRQIVILVSRQQGKTLLLKVLALWWLYVDALGWPEHLNPSRFLLVGMAQDLEQAESTWNEVVELVDPDDKPDPDAPDAPTVALPTYQRLTRKPSRTNGQKSLRTKAGARYQVKPPTRKSVRGKSVHRLVMDELREHYSYAGWDAAVPATTQAFNSQVWAFSNAGDGRSVVLREQRDIRLKNIREYDDYAARGVQDLEDYVNGGRFDQSLGLFEWSAPDGCALDDVDAIRQANPSLGYGSQTLADVLSLSRTMRESSYRTEHLCQWVESMDPPFLDPADWKACLDGPTPGHSGSELDPESEICWGVDVSANRSYSFVSVAGYRVDNLIHAELVAQRGGMMWVQDVLPKLAERWGCWTVALQTRGTPSAELVDTLEGLGFTIVRIEGFHVGAATGTLGDRFRDHHVRTRDQPALNLAAASSISKKLGEVSVIDRAGSPVDASPLVSLAHAIYGLEVMPEPEMPPVSAYETYGLAVI